MDFLPIPDDLGDFGDCGGVGTASFSFDNFSLEEGEAIFRQTGAGTSSTAGVTEATGTSDGAPSRPPRLSRGDPIYVVYSLETHAWTVHHHPVSPYLFPCYLLT